MRPPRSNLALALLSFPARLYENAIRLRNRHYDRPGSAHQASLPVLSVGNLTVGGTGKTPFVAWLSELLRENRKTPAIVSRGYGGRAGRGPLLVSRGDGPLCAPEKCGDEPFLLARRLPKTLVIAGSDRLRGAAYAKAHGADVVILDDGFQHRRLARDLDILLIDAGNPFGNHRLLPAGWLREPLCGISRAGVVVITHGRPGEESDKIEVVVRRFNDHAPILHATHQTVGFFDREGLQLPVPRRAVAFCGIGSPQRFRGKLDELGVDVVEFRPHPDHHAYSEAELLTLQKLASAHDAQLVTTEKDLARLESALLDTRRPAPIALRIKIQLQDPAPILEQLRRLELLRTGA